MKQNKAEIYLSRTDSDDEAQTTTTRLRSLCEQFRKRKLIWIAFSIILVMLIIIIPTVIITTKKQNIVQSTTELTSMMTMIETIELTTNALTTEISTIQTTTKVSTIEMTTEPETIPAGQFLSSLNITDNTKWKQSGPIVVGQNSHGNQLYQLVSPMGIYIDDSNETIYIADTRNHRIVKWKYGAKMGELVAGGNGPGIQMNQMGFPFTMIVDEINDSLITCEWGAERVQRFSLQNRTNQQIIISNVRCAGLALDNRGYIYVSDNVNHSVTRWKEGETYGTIVAGGNGKGDLLNQLNSPGFIFVDEDYSVYVSDYSNHRIMKWVNGEMDGIVIAGSEREGNNLTQLSNPRGVIVDHLGNIYVADSNNHRVVRWLKGAKEGTVIVGGNGPGEKQNQFWHPTGISFDRQGNLYVASTARVQKFPVVIY